MSLFYASLPVFILIPNGIYHQCIDNRNLTAVTAADSCHLKRIYDLLNEAQPTSFKSIIDLLAGYHQVRFHPDDQYKTTFACPFGVYKFLGLRNGHYTFQTLTDRFRNGFEVILTLVYRDYFILLSKSFVKIFQNYKLFSKSYCSSDSSKQREMAFHLFLCQIFKF
ncbi:transposon Ty3-I Gag-Pol polyprotein [Caerostris extrusa]|uniref:Transposon Ty3-I Gag-Pol polyprotein n=1 Tax=Caerostris extrusa TaxID=172846 RepID=A0AAV4N9G5_CAEEX|nr:transposon Ty3-I Gag-Pol polyprotein [Caerostris extrusa]